MPRTKFYRLTRAGIAVSGSPRGAETPRRKVLGYMRMINGPVSSDELAGRGLTGGDIRVLSRPGGGQLIYEVGTNGGSDEY